VEEVYTESERGVSKELMASLATGGYIQNGESVLITGASGCGKSFIASALGHQACMQGHKVAYFNLQKFLLRTKMARLEGTIIKFFEKLAKLDLVIIDDFGLTYLEQQQRMDLMEIVEDRHGQNSLIIASQLPVANWYDIIGEETIADAILDRLVHTSHRIELKGDSLRKKR
jgi:DNA replication protein DnaC